MLAGPIVYSDMASELSLGIALKIPSECIAEFRVYFAWYQRFWPYRTLSQFVNNGSHLFSSRTSSSNQQIPPMFTVFELFNEWNRRNKSYTVEFGQVKMYRDSRLRDFPFRKDVSHLSCNLSKCGTAQMIWINKKSLSIRWLMRNTVERENYITFLGNPTFIMG